MDSLSLEAPRRSTTLCILIALYSADTVSEILDTHVGPREPRVLKGESRGPGSIEHQVGDFKSQLHARVASTHTRGQNRVRFRLFSFYSPRANLPFTLIPNLYQTSPSVTS